MNSLMKKILPIAIMTAAILVPFGARLAGQKESRSNAPVFSADNQLMKPENYREWVYLSSGLGMSYGPLAQSNSSADPPFDNVFVTPEAYRSFLQTGTWPDKTKIGRAHV